jgi:stage II sporulation protein D
VQATRGQVLTYQGRPATVFFHSTCGYATASPAEVFRSVTGQPYLRSVSDRRPGGGDYCDISPRYRWRVEWDRATLTATLRRSLPAVLGIDPAAIDAVTDVRVAHTGPSGRPSEIRIRVGRGEIPVYGPDIRAVLRTPAGEPLGGSAFQLSTREDGTLVAAGAGWGHGVGLCQWGAVGRARAGQSTRAIVLGYFPGASLTRWY